MVYSSSSSASEPTPPQQVLVVVMSENDNPAPVEKALSDIKQEQECQNAIEKLSAARARGPGSEVYSDSPFSEETLALWRANINRRDASWHLRMISLQEMPSDEIVQDYLRVALLERTQVFFEVSERLLGFE
jgi:hypothetical protein